MLVFRSEIKQDLYGMAASLWGKIYYDGLFAGELRQEPGGRCVFAYDFTFLEASHPSIAFTLPRQAPPHICEQGLHPFFDNLVAEGWLRNAQARALKVNPDNRFGLLLAFGHDCACEPRFALRNSAQAFRGQGWQVLSAGAAQREFHIHRKAAVRTFARH